YGYTFVSKGTVPEFVEDLQHESAVYEQLKPLQGSCIPVLLGAIDLRELERICYYDFRVRIVYMIFVSWAGTCLDEADLPEDIKGKVRQEVEQSLRAVHSMQVVHRDIRKSNMFWNNETNKTMIIDFERAILLDSPQLPLREVIPGRKVQQEAKSVLRLPYGLAQHDIAEARALV
ncbi:uncharacterized protein BCR38DRAFT_347104, partial [Pseudomassariella vexata]